jgi:diguanylate cyclase (GGDEF)-like protein
MTLQPLRKPWVLICGGVLVALSVLAFEAVRAIQHAYRTEVTEILAANDRTVQKLANRTTEVFEAVDRSTLMIKFLKETGKLPPLADLRTAGLTSKDIIQFVQITNVRGFITDTTTKILYENIADEEFFHHHWFKFDPNILIAPLWANPVDGTLGIPVVRRLGSTTVFEGVVVATVNPAALSVAYAKTEAEGTVISVLGVDGNYRARSVNGALTLTEKTDPARVIKFAEEAHATGEPIKSPIDGVMRFVSVMKLERYPLYAVVAVDAEHALALYRHTRSQVIAWASLLGLAIAAAGWVLLAQTKRLMASQRRTEKAETVFRATLEGSMDAVTILGARRDADGKLVDMTIEDCNSLAASMIEKPREALLGTALCEAAPTIRSFLPSFEHVIKTQKGVHAEVPAAEPHLRGRWLHHQLVPLDGGVALITRDVTEKKKAEEALAELARSDGLTNLANRRYFETVLDEARARAARSGEALALLYIDLDGFKKINDTFGHAAGDAVLVEVARRLKSVFRVTDMIARLGGDEFAVIAERAGTVENVTLVCERVVNALKQPHDLDGESALATPSVGVAIFDGQESAKSLRDRADSAMYLAKTTGKSRYVRAIDLAKSASTSDVR